jgi:hypothetical protein
VTLLVAVLAKGRATVLIATTTCTSLHIEKANMQMYY